MNVREVGEYIRNQRTGARLSLRKMSGLAGVSIPYLSQIERGLRRPSADILQAIAKGLRISAETLYVKAGMLEDRTTPDVAAAIMADVAITERQKQALVQIYEAFREEAGRTSAESTPPPAREGTVSTPGSKKPSAMATAKAPGKAPRRTPRKATSPPAGGRRTTP